jgi:hypothetical protein
VRSRRPAAYGNPFQHQRVQALGGAVDGSRQSGGSTTDDNNVVDLPWYRAVREPELVRQYARAALRRIAVGAITTGRSSKSSPRDSRIRCPSSVSTSSQL